MYVLIVSARVKPEQRGTFSEAIEANAVSSVNDEPGCLRFDVVRDNDDLDRYLFYEVYRDQEAFAAHRASDHFARWREAARASDAPGGDPRRRDRHPQRRLMPDQAIALLERHYNSVL